MPLLLTEQPVIDVWAAEGMEGSEAWGSARRRFLLAREGWLQNSGVAEVAEQCRLLPIGAVRPRPAPQPLSATDLAAQRATVQDFLDMASRIAPPDMPSLPY